jgi:hypothetical protein
MAIRSWLVCLVLSALTGCANYHAVGDFADETKSMTGVVRAEFVQLDTLCVQQAETVIVVNNLGDDRALAQCDRYRRSQSRFAALTVDVLDAYAAGLASLADDKPFDLTPDIKTVGGKVRALKDSGGDALVTTAEATAVTRIADLLVTVFAAGKRDDAVRRMIAAAPDLETMGRTLKAFFVGPSTPASSKPPYVNFISIISSSTTSTQLVLDSQPMRRAEPIRTAELSRELKARQKLLEQRSSAVPTSIAAAIDAWLAALERFEVEGLKPDRRELADRLKTLRDATRTAKAAVASN